MTYIYRKQLFSWSTVAVANHRAYGVPLILILYWVLEVRIFGIFFIVWILNTLGMCQIKDREKDSGRQEYG
jgi:hypothetical protein